MHIFERPEPGEARTMIAFQYPDSETEVPLECDAEEEVPSE
jgi:hypothetical protein